MYFNFSAQNVVSYTHDPLHDRNEYIKYDDFNQ